jgi:hypothetical protein
MGTRSSKRGAVPVRALRRSGGMALATAATGFGHVEGGGAALAHSGGLFGTFSAAWCRRRSPARRPSPPPGLGYGAIGGVLVAGAVGTGSRDRRRECCSRPARRAGGARRRGAGQPLMVGDYQSRRKPAPGSRPSAPGRWPGPPSARSRPAPTGPAGARGTPRDRGAPLRWGRRPGHPTPGAPFVGAGLTGRF